jgi:leucyl aminopeptidase (aminopeptidase T)
VRSEEGQAPALAATLLGDVLRLRKGENVVVETWSHSVPYATACVVEARRRGAHPLLWLEDERAFWNSLDGTGNVRQWSRVGAHEWAALSKADAYVFFPGPGDRPRYAALPDELRRAITSFNDEWYRRARARRLRGVRCLLGYASDLQANAWGVSGTAWRSSLIQGIVGADLAQVRADARRATERLRRGRTLRITGANGTDLTVGLAGRAPVPDDGVVGPEDLSAGRNLTNAPPGTVVVAIDERKTEGTLVANRPSFLRHGRVEGGQWEFHEGHLLNFWYTDGQSHFEEEFRRAPERGRDVAGFFSVGLNAALGPGVPQVEDQEAGAITVGIGGNEGYGGKNASPFLSWLVLGEATVAVDGKPLLDRGKLLQLHP